ncbi:hypothetical protein FJY63_02780 [Candidatus Sumerlaeota bacterium]|nr:hypothetical protein [Candidatus Sumerlaeota bacterium]
MEPGDHPDAAYYLYLPLKDNAGKHFGQKKFKRVQRELRTRFGGCTFSRCPKKGHWVHKGVTYEDDVYEVEVWIARTRENLQWLSNYRKILARRFKQIEIGAKIVAIGVPE